MKNEGLIITVICLCVTILMSAIIALVVSVTGGDGTNQLTRSMKEMDKEKRYRKSAEVTNDELLRLGTT